ncbi:MAG: preprotein translocase subunit SecE [Arsenophonus sp.]
MSLNSNHQENRFSFDIAKWLSVTILLIISIAGNYYFKEYNPLLRIIGVVIIIIFAGGIALWTTNGKEALKFSSEARIEMRKVIWPTRSETLQTTLIVVIVTVFMALILWGLDGILVRSVSFITGLRF